MSDSTIFGIGLRFLVKCIAWILLIWSAFHLGYAVSLILGIHEKNDENLRMMEGFWIGAAEMVLLLADVCLNFIFAVVLLQGVKQNRAKYLTMWIAYIGSWLCMQVIVYYYTMKNASEDIQEASQVRIAQYVIKYGISVFLVRQLRSDIISDPRYAHQD